MKYLYPLFFALLFVLLCLTVWAARTVCPVCGRSVYLLLFRFCGC